MNDAANFVFLEDFGEQGFIPHVALIELQLLPGEEFHPVQGFGIGIAKIVDDHNAIAAFQQLQTGVGADIARAAGYKHIHEITSTFIFFHHSTAFA